MDPHAPYYPPTEAFRGLTGRDIDPVGARYLNEYWNRSDLAPSSLSVKRDEVVQLYDAGIRWVDDQDCQIGWPAQANALVGRLCLCSHRGSRRGVSRTRRPLSLADPTERRSCSRATADPCSWRKRSAGTSFSDGRLHLGPTLLEYPERRGSVGVSGRSLWKNLQSGVPWDDLAIIECAYGCTNPFRAETRKAPRLLGVRDARFKLVMRIESGAVEELYDLKADPGEMRQRKRYRTRSS